MADESDSFGLGRICERIARSRKIHCNRIEFFTAANKLAAMGTYDLTKGTREIVSSTGIVSGGNGVSLTYAGVFYQYKRSGWDAVREILSVECPRRNITIQRGIPGSYDLIRVVDLEEREHLKVLLRKSAHPNGTYPDMEAERFISCLVGVEDYINGLIGVPEIAAE